MYIEGASSRCLNAPPPCTDADDLLRCSATVGDLGERGELYILTKVRHWDVFRALRTVQSTRDLNFKHDCELHGNGEIGNPTVPGSICILHYIYSV